MESCPELLARDGEHVALPPISPGVGDRSLISSLAVNLEGVAKRLLGPCFCHFTNTLSLPEFCPHDQTPAIASDRKPSVNWLGP